MKNINSNYRIFRITLYSSNSPYVFSEEKNKYAFLQSLQRRQRKSKLTVLSYCVTDREGHLLIAVKKHISTVDLLKTILNDYRKETVKWQWKIREYSNWYETLQEIQRIMAIPAEEQIVKSQEDYWWTSYHDYHGDRPDRLVNWMNETLQN